MDSITSINPGHPFCQNHPDLRKQKPVDKSLALVDETTKEKKKKDNISVKNCPEKSKVPYDPDEM